MLGLGGKVGTIENLEKGFQDAVKGIWVECLQGLSKGEAIELASFSGGRVLGVKGQIGLGCSKLPHIVHHSQSHVFQIIPDTCCCLK